MASVALLYGMTTPTTIRDGPEQATPEPIARASLPYMVDEPSTAEEPTLAADLTMVGELILAGTAVAPGETDAAKSL